MSDVPFITACLFGLYGFYRYIETRYERWFFATCLFASASYLIRQPGLLFFPAIAVFLFFEKNRQPAALLKGAIACTWAVLLYVVVEKFAKPGLGISDNYVPVGELYVKAILEQPLQTVVEWIKKLVKTFVYLGFFTLPFFPFYVGSMKNKGFFRPRQVMWVILPNLALLAWLVKIGKVFPFGGNILYNFGLGTETLFDVYTLGLPNTYRLPEWMTLLVNFTSQISASFWLILVVKNFGELKTQNQKFSWFLLLINGLYLPAISITSFFDRYLLLPVVSFFFIIGAMAKGNPSKRHSWLLWLPMVIMSLYSIAGTKDFLAWNRARYRAFQFLTKQGVSIRDIDAGYALNGFYNYHPAPQRMEDRSFWWVTNDEWVITFGPVPGYRLAYEFPYRRWLPFKTDNILVLKKE